MSSRSKRYFIETWGCQMNELDSQRMAGQLMQQGYLPTREAAEADLILLNSCSVREKAEQKVYSRLGQYRRFKQERQPDQELMIGLCGCVATQVGEAALKRVPDLDFVLGAARVGDLGDIIRRRRQGERAVVIDFPEESDYEMDAISREGEFKGMVTIIEGCNKNCTFCIVPKTRGPERCRPLADVLTEVRHLVDYGFREIELLGQTVNHWRDPSTDVDFAVLLDQVAQVPGVERLRFVTSYPRDFSLAMVEQFARHENICPYLHLPAQSGSNSVLKAMGRGYTVEEYDRLVEALRRARPDLALSTDLIVGFPGETEEDFRRTLALVERTRYASLFAFMYSVRPYTAAPKLPDHVELEVASRRLQELLALQNGIQHELNRELVGRSYDVLVTGFSRDQQSLVGRTTCHRKVHFDFDRASFAGSPLGQLMTVEIERALPHSLIARRVGREFEATARSSSPLQILS